MFNVVIFLLFTELYEICCQRAKEKLDSFSHSKTQNGHYHQEPVQSGELCFRRHVSVVNLVAVSVDPDDVVDRENTVELIHLDVARTFPSLGIFQKVFRSAAELVPVC